MTYWVIALGVLALDQITKWLVRTRIGIGELRPVLGEFLQLTHVRNTGAAFGVFPGQRIAFIFVTLGVLAFVAAYWRRSRPAAWPLVVALGLVTSGALGNFIDRATVGRVTDFLYLKFIDFPVFNVADSAITVGVIILMAWLLFVPEGTAETDRTTAETDRTTAETDRTTAESRDSEAVL